MDRPAPAPTSDAGFPGAALAERYQTAFAAVELADGRIVSCCTDSARAIPSGSLRENGILWLGCLSKPITATAVLILHDCGELALDDRLARFAALPSRVGSLTVEELLAHRGGLPREPPDWRSFFDREWMAEPLRGAANRVPDPDPVVRGSRFYSSMGYILLARLVEVISGMEFSAFVAREIFDPLAMRDSFAINRIPRSHVARTAPVLERQASQVCVAFDPRHSDRIVNSMPFAGFFSTVHDVGCFLQMMLDRGAANGRTLLGEETVARMFCETGCGNGIHQGLGWFLGFSPDALGGPAPCGFWRTSSTGSLMAANLRDRSAIVILGQRLLTNERIPLRAAQWAYARNTVSLASSSSAAASRAAVGV